MRQCFAKNTFQRACSVSLFYLSSIPLLTLGQLRSCSAYATDSPTIIRQSCNKGTSKEHQRNIKGTSKETENKRKNGQKPTSNWKKLFPQLES